MGVRVREWKGAWWVFINHQRRRKAKRIGEGEEARRLANELAQRMIIRLAYGEDPEPRTGVPDLAAYADDWLRNVKVIRKISTWEVYERQMRRVWIPRLGHKRLDQLTRADVKKVLFDVQAQHGYGRTYMISILTTLQGCLTEAVDDQLIANNPALRQARNIAKPHQADDDDGGLVLFTEAEVKAILQGAIERWPDMYPKILTLARTGMREGEMLALQRDDIHFARQQIQVRRTWGSRHTQKYHGLCINVPKSGKWRWVDMSPQLAHVLRSYIDRLEGQGPWLFPGRTPELPIHPGGFLYMWKRVLDRTVVPYRKPHALRHSYASVLIHRGEDIIYMRDQLGHASTKVTLDTYGHLIPTVTGSRAAQLDDESWRNPGATTPLRLVAGDDATN